MSITTFPVRLVGEMKRHDDPACGAAFQYAGDSFRGSAGWMHKHRCLKCGVIEWLPHKYPRICAYDDDQMGSPIAVLETTPVPR